MHGVLVRVDQSDHGTFGTLTLPGFSAYTGELPWRNNVSNVSCVPVGTYTCKLTHSPRFGQRLYLLDPVPRRSGIRIHVANLMGDASRGYACQLNGCIALGEKLGWLGRQRAVLLSAPAVRKLHAVTGGQPFSLEIKNA